MTQNESHAQSIQQIVEVAQTYLATAAQQTLYEREQGVLAVLMQIGACLLQTSLQTSAALPSAPDLPCACGGVRHYESRPHGRQVRTRVGTMQVPPRARYRCATCQQRSYPLDERLGLPTRQQLSQVLQEQCAYLATLLPYAQASAVLAYLTACQVGPSQIWHTVQQVGAQEEASQHQDYAVWQEQPPTPVAQTTHQYVSADGVMYCSRDRAAEGTYQWHELKTAAVYDAQPTPVPPTHRAVAIVQRQGETTLPLLDQAQTVTYAASARSWADLGQQTQVELDRRGPQRERIALGDGAPSVQEFFETYARAPGVHVTRILDIRHAEQHLWEVAALLPPSAPPAWLDERRADLDQGDALPLIQALADCAAQATPDTLLQTTAQRAATYFTRHAAHIDYLDFVDHHYQIASGIAESTCKRFGTDRMKGTGMRWSQHGAHHLAILRARVLNHRWPLCSALP